MGKEIFAKRIRFLRESNGLTTRQLSAKLGISHSAITLYELCKREAPLTTIEAYADHFKVSTDYLLGRKE